MELRSVLSGMVLPMVLGALLMLLPLRWWWRRTRAALEASEARYRALVEHSPDVIARLDRQCRHLYVSPSVQRYFPLLPPAEWIGRTYAELGAPRELYEPWEQVVRAVFADGVARELDFRSPTPVGIREFTWRVFPERDAHGRVRAVVGISQDITQRRRLEAQLLLTQKLETVARLAGGVAHDFNNILTAVTGHASLAAERLPAHHPVHEDLAEVLAAAERAARLTRHLLAFSRRQVFQPRLLDLGETVRALAPSVERLAAGEHRLEVRITGEPLQVRADPAQVEEILLNLCENAREALGDGGGVITVSAQRSGADAELQVSDAGRGIDPASLAHVFEPFYSTKDASQGAGLGLPIVYGIAQQLGGSARVESTVGIGTSVLVRIPLATDASPAS